MDSARKVALVPQQLLSMLMAQQQLNPGLKKLQTYDDNMQNMLLNSDVPSDIKHAQYSQMMHKYQTLKDQELNKPMQIDVRSSAPTPIALPDDDDILTGVPKKYKNKARLLLRHVRRSPNMSFDEKGQVIIDGNKIDNSHITDLIFDYSRPSRTREGATGWREFGRALKQTNVPQEAIVNAARWHEIDRPVLAVQRQQKQRRRRQQFVLSPLSVEEEEEQEEPGPSQRRSDSDDDWQLTSSSSKKRKKKSRRGKQQQQQQQQPSWTPFKQKKGSPK